MNVHLCSDKLDVIIKSSGAEIISITNKQGLEYLWQADKSIWPRHAPILFPIVGRLKENELRYQGHSYEMGQHGFARDLNFNLVEKSKTACRFELKSEAQTRKQYPFEFVLHINYQLDGNKLLCSYEVSNTSQKDLPFSIGAHPAFNCPLETEEQFENYYLEFDSPNQKDLLRTKLENGLRTDVKQHLELQNGRLWLKSELFDDDALVFEGQQVNKVSLQSTVSHHKILLECKNWPYFGVWTKKGNTQFICLEPWYGVADQVNATGNFLQKEGIILLKSGDRFNCSFSIQVD